MRTTAPRDLWNPEDYLLQVREAVSQVESACDGSLLEICRRSMGAFPTLVAQFATESVHNGGDHHDERLPYPSPARGEWYFTDDSTARVMDHLGVAPLMIGTPSVAEFATNGTLIDSSPWVHDRFNVTTSTVVINEAVEVLTRLPPADSAVIDPPWYGRVMEDWLKRASSSVHVGGQIVVPLLGELTRPSAKAERAQLQKFMESIGPVTIFERALTYSTPLFEYFAMREAGVALDGPWRIADMAVVENALPQPYPRISTLIEEWRDYRVGDDIISARILPSDSLRAGLVEGNEIRNVQTLDSVSRRHPLLLEANLWSSRNRIGTVDDLVSAHQALEVLSTAQSEPTVRGDKSLVERLRVQMLGEGE